MVAMLPPRSASARVVTLLIDNYDSYTYNLYQMLAQVNGVTPVVFRNDDFGGDWHEAWRAFQDHVQRQFPKSEAESIIKVNVVISPGPGHPGTSSDFGMCADAIRCAQVPLFGVCLGHQGLAQVYGGKVVHAKEVMHGRTSHVSIDANKQKSQYDDQSIASLFSHIPDGVEVVRYHSLVIDEQSLPSELVVTARTDDGVIMGLQHTTKSQFGVQFHPEAVCSAFGYQMLQNFRDLTLQQAPSPCHLQHSELQPHVLERMTVDDCSTTKAAATTMAVLSNSEKEPEYKVRVHVASKGLASLAFAQQVFSDLYADAPRSFWLDSSNYDASSPVQQVTSRFSLMGDNTGPLSACVEYCVLENLLRVYEADGETVLYRDTDILTHLRTQMATFQAHKVEFHGYDDDATEATADAKLPFAFRGGFVGYFGYEVLGSGLEKHKQPQDPSTAAIADALTKRLENGEYVPDASFLFADRTLVFDHLDGNVYSVSVSKSDAVSEIAASQWHALVAKRIRELAVDFVSHTPNPGSTITSTTTSASSPVVFHPSRSRAQYVRDIHEIQRLIRDGETYEVCLTNQLEASYALNDPLGFYKVLRVRNPAPYAGFYMSNPSSHFANSQSQVSPSTEQAHGMTETYAICCSSPERFLRVGSDGWMESKPIKGTRRRGITASEDADIAMELAQCTKDRAENMMIADLVRNDFGVVAQIGSVHVPKLMAVETYATVHQLVTTVRGQRRVDADVVDVLKATFPGGSMTGAPKKRTMQIIRQLEQGPRGVYSGALGYLSLDGSCDLNIIIRTAVVTKKRVALGAGGAVIALSDTDDEYEEMLLKTRALVQAIGVFVTGKDDGTGAKVEPCTLYFVSMSSSSLLRSVWTQHFEHAEPANDVEKALYEHLERAIGATATSSSLPQEEAKEAALHHEIRAKRIYMSSTWGYFEAANIGLGVCFLVAKVDECIIALQEKTKKDFVDPLSWDLLPHPAILATVEAVLLLFNIPKPPSNHSTSTAETMWRNVWGLWIVKNIDAHSSGWEWVATNEPTGLFTKPYALSPMHLDRVEQLLEQAFAIPDSHRCWTNRMHAYACLRDWATACAKYVHMMHHCLPAFPPYADIQKLVMPPKRTPQANVWFRIETPEGIECFYNRLMQSITLTRPEDFDGANVTSIPGVILELIHDALHNDVATRLELEKRSHQRVRDKLLAEDEWIECFDMQRCENFYYSLKHYRIMYTPPEYGAFVSCRESIAYAAVLRLQAAYRRRRLELKLQIKRTKRASLPIFSAFLTRK